MNDYNPIEIPMDPAAMRALVNHVKEVADLNAEANALVVEFIAEQKRLEAEITALRETNAALRELLREVAPERELKRKP